MTTPLISLQQLSRTFPGSPEVHALTNVDLDIRRGDYLSIVGPSGSGKSTMLNILGLLDRPSSGTYLFDGSPASGLDEHQRSLLRAQRIGFVFQAFHLMPRRTVLENVMMPMLYSGVPRAEREARARQALDRVHLSHRLTFRPTSLSGGERQRVAVARAVVSRPDVLLADEPTGNLDHGTSNDVMELFAELNDSGLTLVVITHDVSVADRAHRTARVRDGRLEGEK